MMTAAWNEQKKTINVECSILNVQVGRRGLTCDLNFEDWAFSRFPESLAQMPFPADG